ncbi:MAG: YtxH domain-containing protein [candidate division WOR-3 bacterium]
MCEKEEKKLLPFIGGVVLGVILGVLLTPRSGKENRELISNYAKDLFEKIKTKIEEGKK